MSLYSAGKKGGMTPHSMGKKPVSHGVKVTASAGKNSGTERKGDKSGAAPMGKGK